MMLLILVVVAGFYMAWSIGANDVANAMGTSVGSGALTLRQAVLIAAVLEFSGAFFFGSHVSETIQQGIIDSTVFTHTPILLACGMLSALIGAGIWMQTATYFGWPVSTTHSIIGAVVGFGLVIGGWQAIYWENVLSIVTSWILSPLLGGLLGFLLFSLLRQTIFFSASPVRAAKRLAPLFILIVTFAISLLLLVDGFKQFSFELKLYQSIIVSMLIAGVAAVVGYWYASSLVPAAVTRAEVSSLAPLSTQVPVHRDSETLAATHAEYATVEKIFGRLQILTACMMAFVHGANDVANAIGPLAAAIALLTEKAVTAIQPVPSWTLALGGVGIVIGLATWGWRVIDTIGKKITMLTPTRGFAAEFGAASVVAIASRLGMPISTTHTLVGAVIGVGFAGGLGSLDMSTTRNIFISWVVTIPAGALFSVLAYLLIINIFGL